MLPVHTFHDAVVALDDTLWIAGFDAVIMNESLAFGVLVDSIAATIKDAC